MTSNANFFLNKYKVLVPKDIDSGPVKQKVNFTNISPTPSNSIRDQDGNLFFEFSFPSNQDAEIVIEGYAVLTQDNSIDYKNSGNLSDIPQDILQTSTNSAKYWESDNPEIMKVAQELKSQITGNDKNVYELINNTYKFVVDRIDYSEVKRFGINERQGALATLQGGAAVCMEYSDLFIALMRAQGVPARGAFGYGYSALDSEETGTTSHQWAEVYIPSLGEWISVDTTWGESGHELIGGDLNHFYTHVASISPDIPATTEAQFYGNLAQVPSKIVSVEAIESTPTGEGQTGEELYSEYHQDETSSSISNFIERIKLTLFEINASIDNFLNTLIPNSSPLFITVIKILPILLISFSFTFLLIKRLKGRKKSFEF
jgi:transglutaminase-like putative cysteine protease